MAEAVVNMGKVLSSVTIYVKVVGVKPARARLWLGAQVMKLASLIIGCSLEIEAHVGGKEGENLAA